MHVWYGKHKYNQRSDPDTKKKISVIACLVWKAHTSEHIKYTFMQYSTQKINKLS